MTARTIPAALDDAAARFADHEAIVDGDVRWTFAQLHDRAVEVARALIATGIEPGDRVALWAPNSATWIAASFGVYAAGGVLVPLNTRFRGPEAGHVLRTAGAKLLFTVTNFLDTSYVELLRDVPGLDTLQEIVVLDGEVPSDATAWSDFLDRAGDVSPDVVAQRTAAV